ncbi:hypothetical protein [Dokdonella sp.]|uniref:hypothetical protein n=1 Tax=Dokdonella sp. TaxID=2291710 RepID=UPI001B1C2C35|nr:hypothetical protein [Dokdonella sp.]MBO9663806.1 hypothetical protein [Dokdonella sp.]
MTDAIARVPLRERLREKLPEILIEAGSIVIALLLAFAVNAWNERRQESERAEAARSAILAELRANQQEIDSARGTLKDIVATLQGALDGSKPATHELNVNLGISLLSSAAWRTTLATQTSQRIDFAWITRVAKLYELQDNFLRVQNAAVDQLAALSPGEVDSGRQVASLLLPRLRTLVQLADGLAASYAEILAAPPR